MLSVKNKNCDLDQVMKSINDSCHRESGLHPCAGDKDHDQLVFM